MKTDETPDYLPTFPKSWAEILPLQAVLDAENLMESVYTLQKEMPPEECARPVWPDSPPRILPPRHQVFRALDLTPPQAVRVVILGQDPYPSAGHANGLAFSVSPHVRPFPPSLRNIFREYSACLPVCGNLRE